MRKNKRPANGGLYHVTGPAMHAGTTCHGGGGGGGMLTPRLSLPPELRNKRHVEVRPISIKHDLNYHDFQASLLVIRYSVLKLLFLRLRLLVGKLEKNYEK